MKANLLRAFALVLLFTAGAYAQDTTTTAMSKKEMRRQERAERKARVKDDLKSAGQRVDNVASDIDQGVERNAKVVGDAISTEAKKVGNAVSDKTNKLKAKRDSSRAEKARRDSL